MSIRKNHRSIVALSAVVLSALFMAGTLPALAQSQVPVPAKPAASATTPADKPPAAVTPANKPPVATAPAAAPPATAAPANAAAAPSAAAPADSPPASVTAPTSAVNAPGGPDKNAVLSRWAAKHLVMLYRKETDNAPQRLEPLVQTSTMALEQQFLNKQYQVLQASPEALQAMDQGPGVVVTFAPDAGLSMIYSVYGDVRPQPGVQVGIAEVRIEARVFVGATLLASEQGRGQVQTRTDPATREYGERRGFEIAAQSAATDLVTRIDDRLRRLTPQQVEQMILGDTSTATSFVLVKPPAPAAAVPAPSGPPAAQPPPVSQPAAPVQAAGKRWLLSVGVPKRRDSTARPLEGVAYDTRHVRDALRGFGFSEGSTIELFGESATVAALRNSLTQLASSVGPQDTVVMYMSGHGTQLNFSRTGLTMPVLYDSSSTNLFDFDQIMRLFAQIPAKERIMIVDTCFSGGAATGLNTVSIGGSGASMGRSGGAPDLVLMMRNVKDATGSIAVMSAATAEETAMDLGAPRGGLFTEGLVRGLIDTRGEWPLENLYRDYVWAHVTRICAQIRAQGDTCKQNPVLGYQGAGNVIRFAGP